MPRQRAKTRAKSISVTDVQTDPSDHTAQAHNVTIGPEQPDHPTDPGPKPNRAKSVRHKAQSAFNRNSEDDGSNEMGETQRESSEATTTIEQPEPPPPIGPITPSASKTPRETDTGLPALTPLQARFFEAWKATGFQNATEAYRTLGIPSASEEALRHSASRLSREPVMLAHRDAYWESLAITPSELLGDLALTARVDPAELGTLYTEDEQGRRRVDWDMARQRGVSRMIKHVSLDRSGNETIEWHDTFKARELLARIMGLTKDSASISVNVESLSIDELKAIVNG